MSPGKCTPEWGTWDLWEQWRGDPELVAQVARASIWALRDGGIRRPTCRVDVHVGGDTESFASPRSFLQEVTKDALHTLDDISVQVEGDSTTVRTSFVIRGVNDESLKAGVLLSITTRNESIRDKLPAVRSRVVAAIERGRSKHASERISGSQESGPSPREALEYRRAESQSVSWSQVVYVGGFAAAALWFVWSYFLDQTRTPVAHLGSVSISRQPTLSESLGNNVDKLPLFLVGGLVAGYLYTLLGSLQPTRSYVELTGVRSAATWRRVGISVLSKGALSLVGAVVTVIAGYYLKKWLGFGLND
jgi:hypothetical protein